MQLAPSIRRELAQLDKSQPVYDIKSMKQQLADDLGGTYLFTGMLAVFAVVALLLAAAGVYGLVSFSVSQRMREIGVRMALGTRAESILGMVVARGSVLADDRRRHRLGRRRRARDGDVAGSSHHRFRRSTRVLVVVVPLFAVALFATCIPARRATQVDPLLARAE